MIDVATEELYWRRLRYIGEERIHEWLQQRWVRLLKKSATSENVLPQVVNGTRQLVFRKISHNCCSVNGANKNTNTIANVLFSIFIRIF